MIYCSLYYHYWMRPQFSAHCLGCQKPLAQWLNQALSRCHVCAVRTLPRMLAVPEGLGCLIGISSGGEGKCVSKWQFKQSKSKYSETMWNEWILDTTRFIRLFSRVGLRPWSNGTNVMACVGSSKTDLPCCPVTPETGFRQISKAI